MATRNQRLRWWVSVPCLCLIVCLSACLSACNGSHSFTLSVLHLPGVRQIVVPSSVAGMSGIGWSVPYTPYGTSEQRNLFQSADTVPLGDLYDVRLDGSGVRRVRSAPGCLDLLNGGSAGPIAVSPNGLLGTCAGQHDTPVFTLAEPTTSGAAAAFQPFSLDQPLAQPVWSPDGQRIAGICALSTCHSLVVYQLNPEAQGVRESRELTLPEHCADNGLSWSPDGQWLTLDCDIAPERSATGSDIHSYLLPIADLLAHAPPGQAPIPVRLDQLTDLGHIGGPHLWRLRAGMLRLTVGDEGRIEELDLRTHTTTTLLTIPINDDGVICSAGWTPDAQHLVFLRCVPKTTDYATGIPPAQLYIYTPPDASAMVTTHARA